MKFTAVVLSGGTGSRLWPVSRKQHPKPFIKMGDGYSLLQHTVLRLLKTSGVNDFIHVTNQDLIFELKTQCQSILASCQSSTDTCYMLEPIGKNTAPAIAFAALQAITLHGEDVLMLVMPSDHMIQGQEAFNNAVKQAFEIANQDKLVTFGIKPNAPETGYGYIEIENRGFVQRFIEKPCLEDAQHYIASPHFFWNAGMFCFKAKILLAEMELHCPDILATVKNCFNRSTEDGNHHIVLDKNTFHTIRADSLDYAVMEKSNQIALVPCSFEWCDMGNWQAFHQQSDADENGNVIKGEAILNQTQDCYIESHQQQKMLGVVGAENLIIIDTPDALLIANKNNAQDVKQIYEKLQSINHPTHALHVTVSRPWGKYRVLEERAGFKVKYIEINPGGKLSLQKHQHRMEHWVVVQGQAHVVNDEREYILDAGQNTLIFPNHLHRLANLSPNEILVVIEVQMGQYVGEDDIVRVSDVYHRVEAI